MKGIKARPTMYAGVQMRSSLEARWAAFFDIVGWDWQYEPTDLAGYIPDYTIQLQHRILVEVKPFIWDGAEDEEQELAHARVKIDQSGWTGEAWIVGVTVLDADGRNATHAGVADWSCGMYREDGVWGPAGLYACAMCNGKTPFHRDLSWHCRICGADERARFRMQPWDVTADMRRAANAVQWRAA